MLSSKEETKSLSNYSKHPQYGSILGQATKEQIIKEYIEPNYIYDVKDTIHARRRWRRYGHIFETGSKVCLAASGIFSFSSGYFQNPFHSFLAGTCSTLSLASLQFSSYCFRQSKKNTEELNTILTTIGIQPIPDLNKEETIKENTSDTTDTQESTK
jgi:hypothetical protein